MRIKLTALLLMTLVSVRVFALDMSERLSFDIPPQRLASALLEFSHQARVQVVIGREVVEQTTSGIKGTHSISEALNQLLKNTSLQYSVVGDTSITVGAAASTTAAEQTIETVNVFGSLEDTVDVGSKTGLSLRETPKSVTIVSRERMEAQNLTTLVDVMNQATGITVRTYGPVEAWYMSRGYRVGTTQLDGGAPISAGFGNVAAPDSAMFERVEVLRGVDGMFSGAGDPGGVINLVRKRAPRASEVSATVTAGRWNNYRGEFDAGGPLAFDGALRGRVVGVYHDQEFFWDRATSDRKMFYGVLESDVGRATFSVGGSYEHRNEQAVDMSGLPSFSNGVQTRLPRETNLAPDWAFRDVSTKEIFTKAELPLTDDVSVRLNVTRQEQDAETAEMYISGAIDPETLTGSTGLGIGADSHSKRTLADLYVGGKFDLFSRQHSFAIGVDYAQMNGGGGRSYQYDDYPWGLREVDVFNYDPGAFPPSARTPTYLTALNRQTQRGAYATLGFKVTDPLRLVVGGRYTDYEIEAAGFDLNPDGSLGAASTWPASYRESAFVPSAALVFEFNDRWSGYASYAQAFNPQGSLLQAPLP
ncbi:TonB-dependent siderophore receptor, partial [Steroidobacter sp.]|uniref:TonB-dependent siderophore receptor n=1 Tax=Steroidobacter sp. TaxID=1978227 RepID=UPI001A453F6C